MKVVSVYSPKGGVGKSNLCINLAGAAVDKGLKVAVVDKDKRQLSCVFIASFNALGFPVFDKMLSKKQMEEYDLILIDHAPSLEELPAGDPILFPYAPSTYDIGSVTPVIDELRAKGKSVKIVMSKINFQRRESKEFALEQQQEHGAHIIKDRSVYLNAGNECTTIFDKQFKSSYGAKDARFEMNELLESALR